VTLPAHWVLATGNRGKVAELTALLADAGLGITVTAQSDLGVAAAAETAATFVENALAKARHAARAAGLPAMADDSGLVVPALGGAPGVRSARFAGERGGDAANVAKLLTALAAKLDRSAEFHCALVALMHPDDPAPLIATGAWKGEIARGEAVSSRFLCTRGTARHRNKRGAPVCWRTKPGTAPNPLKTLSERGGAFLERMPRKDLGVPIRRSPTATLHRVIHSRCG
jgi:XTP/dITP diphosphohydrolase